MICGVIGLFTVRDSSVRSLKNNAYLQDLVYGFRPQVVRENKYLYLSLVCVCIFCTSVQVFMPYLFIYLNKTLGFDTMTYSLVMAIIVLTASVFAIVLGTLMLPSQVTVVSQYIMYNKLNLTDTYFPLVLPYILGGGAFFIFLMVQFIRTIPRELDESAKIDGAGIFRIYKDIVMPLLVAPLTTVAIYAFTWSWDDFYSQMLYLSTPAKFTVGLGLRMLIDAWDIQWGQLLAMSLLSILPALILFFSRQKDFVEGVTTGAVKG